MVCVQVPATQPLLILATCQRPPEELPPVLLNFFQPHSPAATAAVSHPSQHSHDNMVTDGSNNLTTGPIHHAGSVASSQVIVIESEAEAEAATAGSWHEAVNRSAEAAAHAVAAAAAFSFQQKLLRQAFAASNQQVSHGSPFNAQNPSSSQVRPGQSLNGPVAEADRADGKVWHDGVALGHGEGKDPVQAGRMEAASKGAKAVNENELQHGLQLHAEVGLCIENSI